MFDNLMGWAMTEGGLAWVIVGCLVVGYFAGYVKSLGKGPIQQTFNMGTINMGAINMGAIEPGEEWSITSTTIRGIEAISQADFEALEKKDDKTVYLTTDG